MVKMTSFVFCIRDTIPTIKSLYFFIGIIILLKKEDARWKYRQEGHPENSWENSQKKGSQRIGESLPKYLCCAFLDPCILYSGIFEIPKALLN